MGISVGKLHHIGKRESQQDSLGTVKLQDTSILAVIADGMGGLSDGEKVSQMIVYTMLYHAADLLKPQVRVPLFQLAGLANKVVREDSQRQLRSGSTLAAVWQRENRIFWITVGDSRIYLYRNGQLLQLNQDHIYQRELLTAAVNGKITFDEALDEPQADCLTSYIGMGNIRHMDGNVQELKLISGDRILLMSDGVFRTVTEKEIAGIIAEEKEAEKAAKKLLEEVLKKDNPYQDNFTAVILGWDDESLQVSDR